MHDAHEAIVATATKASTLAVLRAPGAHGRAKPSSL